MLGRRNRRKWACLACSPAHNATVSIQSVGRRSGIPLHACNLDQRGRTLGGSNSRATAIDNNSLAADAFPQQGQTSQTGAEKQEAGRSRSCDRAAVEASHQTVAVVDTAVVIAAEVGVTVEAPVIVPIGVEKYVA